MRPLGRKKYKLQMLSVQHASGNREYMREVVQNMKDRLGHDDSGNIGGLRGDAHFDMDAVHGFIDAGGIAHGPEFRIEFGIILEL